MDYIPFVIFGIVIVSAVVFLVLFAESFGGRASTRSQLSVLEIGSYAGALVFALMALSGESTGWIVGAIMFANGTWATVKRAEQA